MPVALFRESVLTGARASAMYMSSDDSVRFSLLLLLIFVWYAVNQGMQCHALFIIEGLLRRLRLILFTSFCRSISRFLFCFRATSHLFLGFLTFTIRRWTSQDYTGKFFVLSPLNIPRNAPKLPFLWSPRGDIWHIDWLPFVSNRSWGVLWDFAAHWSTTFHW